MRDILCKNPDLSGQESTYLTKIIAIADGDIYIKDAASIVKDDYLILGRVGDENSEIVQVSAVTADALGWKITLVADCINPHAKTDLVQKTLWNMVNIYWSATESGVYVLLEDEIPIEPDDIWTRYTDATGISGRWYYYTFLNHDTSEKSSATDSQKGFAGTSYCTLDNTLYGDRDTAVSLQDLKNYLGIKISDKSKDAKLDIIRRGVIKAFEDGTGYCLIKRTVTFYPEIGSCQSDFMVDFYPIYTTPSKLFNGVSNELDYDSDPNDSDYQWKTYGAIQTNQILIQGYRQVYVTYIAWCGPEMPADLEMALLDQMAILSQEKKRIYVDETGTQSAVIMTLSPPMEAIIKKYRRITI